METHSSMSAMGMFYLSWCGGGRALVAVRRAPKIRDYEVKLNLAYDEARLTCAQLKIMKEIGGTTSVRMIPNWVMVLRCVFAWKI